MARHRSHSVAFKRQVAQEFVSGETLHGLAKRHDLSRNLIRLWVSAKPVRSMRTRPLPT
jgi:transposase